MHAVHEHVEVRVRAVLVCDDQGLMAVQSERREHPVGDALHRRAVDRVGGVEGQREVIDGLLHAHVPRGRRAHDRRREFGVVRREVSRARPRDAPFLEPRATVHEVPGERPESDPAARHGDHRRGARAGAFLRARRT
jgi:hypothetical protein